MIENLNKIDKFVFALSGGRDSTATLIWGLQNLPREKIICVFADTKAEFPEVYTYLEKIESVLDIKINRVANKLGYEEFLAKYSYFLPSPIARWCTKKLKIDPIDKWTKEYLKETNALWIVGARIDEKRRNIPAIRTETKNGLQYRPGLEFGWTESKVNQICNESGIGISSIYKIRSRTGCWCCFFQGKKGWLKLAKYYPDLYDRAIWHEDMRLEMGLKKGIEKVSLQTYLYGISLRELREKEERQVKLFPDEAMEGGKNEYQKVGESNQRIGRPIY